MPETIKKLSHDLWSPISVIKGFLEEIGKVDLSSEMREYHEIAVRSINKMIRLLDSVPENKPAKRK